MTGVPLASSLRARVRAAVQALLARTGRRALRPGRSGALSGGPAPRSCTTAAGRSATADEQRPALRRPASRHESTQLDGTRYVLARRCPGILAACAPVRPPSPSALLLPLACSERPLPLGAGAGGKRCAGTARRRRRRWRGGARQRRSGRAARACSGGRFRSACRPSRRRPDRRRSPRSSASTTAARSSRARTRGASASRPTTCWIRHARPGFVARYRSDQRLVWERVLFADERAVVVADMALVGGGEVVVVGWFGGTLIVGQDDTPIRRHQRRRTGHVRRAVRGRRQRALGTSARAGRATTSRAASRRADAGGGDIDRDHGRDRRRRRVRAG